jgi:hypothetical protein
MGAILQHETCDSRMAELDALIAAEGWDDDAPPVAKPKPPIKSGGSLLRARGIAMPYRLRPDPKLTAKETAALTLRTHGPRRLRVHRLNLAVRAMWRLRACFQCGRHGWCPHREPEVEVALLASRDFRVAMGMEALHV